MGVPDTENGRLQSKPLKTPADLYLSVNNQSDGVRRFSERIG